MNKGIIGAVIGDIAGSTREFKNVSSQRFKLFGAGSTFTDDTVLTLAVAEWMLHWDEISIDEALLKWGRRYPHAGYGRGFKAFLKNGYRNSVGSTHNGSAMRASSIGFLCYDLDLVMSFAEESVLPSHNTESGLTGAQATAAAVFLAKEGHSKEEIRDYLEEHFSLDIPSSYEEARRLMQQRLAMRETDHDRAHEELLDARLTIAAAMAAFLAADDYESAIRLAIYLGGDSDTLACITGGIAAAFWGVPDELVEEALVYLPADMIAMINECDGSDWKPTGITPPNTSRWSRNDLLVYGCNREESEGEAGFYDVRPTRFRHHVNNGWPIFTIGERLEFIAEQVDLLLRKFGNKRDFRLLVKEIGISKAGYSIEQIAPLFRDALHMENVLLPESFIKVLKEAH